MAAGWRGAEPPVERMVGEIEAEAALVGRLTGRRPLRPAVLAALRTVPREAFVPEAVRDRAWDNGPLPIGQGQTISQPYIVALMVDLLELAPDARVLEVGAGSGYQAAVLAQLAREVYAIELEPVLAERARATLDRLGISSIHLRCGDGRVGWPEAAPFDGIVVSAAAEDVPPALLAQLKPGAHLAIPIGTFDGPQVLTRYTRAADGSVQGEPILDVAFVPLRKTR